MYRPVPASQLRTLALSNWLQSVPTNTSYTALYIFFNNWLKSVPTCTSYTALYICFKKLATECTDRYLLHSLVHLLQETGYRVYRLVPATQSCTLASTTGCRVYRPVPLYSLVHLLQETGYRVYRSVPATQPCTLASRNWLQSVLTGTSYTVLYICFKRLATECTDWYLLHSLVHLLQQLVTECTGRYRLYSLVHLL